MENIRHLEIEIFPQDDWSIVDKKLYSTNQKHIDFFANCYIKDDKITYIFDISFYDLERAKKSKFFNEVCEFEVFVNDAFKEKFQGTFIDALEYIKANFKQ
ncbi:hypothetical protein [uncultured Campylobacter sp.]|uniref:hypothetical protein n=1 Tax=uncultured Campylobacter sp. TaxID=218934 RepID=UPI0026071962|nr:hypothetical protein [uncultured Campylobacter sp.]